MSICQSSVKNQCFYFRILWNVINAIRDCLENKKPRIYAKNHQKLHDFGEISVIYKSIENWFLEHVNISPERYECKF